MHLLINQMKLESVASAIDTHAILARKSRRFATKTFQLLPMRMRQHPPKSTQGFRRNLIFEE
jgi:hypothetical protein